MSIASAPTVARSSSAYEVRSKWIWVGAAIVVVFLAYWVLLGMFFRQQWEKAHYQYFPFVIAAFAWLLWDRYAHAEKRADSSTWGRWFDVVLLTAAVALQAAAIYLLSPWGAIVSLTVLVAYGFRVLSRTRKLTNLWGIWVLLLLLIPLPFDWDQTLITKLQGISSRISSFALDAVGVNHLMDGNALALPNKQLFVDEACSGIISILSVVACAVIYAVVKNRSPLHLVLLAVIGIGWATVINVGRISLIAFVFDRWGIDWSSGALHEILSLALFMVTFLALLSSDVLLSVALEPVANQWHDVHAADLQYGSWLAKAWDALVSAGQPESARISAVPITSGAPRDESSSMLRALRWPVFIFTPLAVAQTALFIYALRVAPERLPTVQRAMTLNGDALAADFAGLKQVNFEAQQRSNYNMHGKYSRTFRYAAAGGGEFFISLDFPFENGWHELTMCYTATGWEPLVRNVVPQKDERGKDWVYIEADFQKQGFAYGTVFFTEFDQYGDVVQPKGGFEGPNPTYLSMRTAYLEDRKTFQVQVFVTSPGPISDEAREQARELLIQARSRFRDLILSPETPSAAPAAQPSG